MALIGGHQQVTGEWIKNRGPRDSPMEQNLFLVKTLRPFNPEPSSYLDATVFGAFTLNHFHKINMALIGGRQQVTGEWIKNRGPRDSPMEQNQADGA
jgi:hypothetical protein